MIFTTQSQQNNLENVILTRHKKSESVIDHLIIISGYVSLEPIKKLSTLPFSVTVAAGMYGKNGQGPAHIHNQIVSQDNRNDQLKILYTNAQIHSKLYLWISDGNPILGLIGSANFATPSLKTPDREVLADPKQDDLYGLMKYAKNVLYDSQRCFDYSPYSDPAVQLEVDSNVCKMTLLMKNGEIHGASGLNWGMRSRTLGGTNNTHPDDGCIPIRTDHIRDYPKLFPAKALNNRTGKHDIHDAVEILFDDNTSMTCKLEGSQPDKYSGISYPKQIASYDHKKLLGQYLRNRLNVPLYTEGTGIHQPVEKKDLTNYGRTDVDLSLIEEGIYKLDFSVS